MEGLETFASRLRSCYQLMRPGDHLDRATFHERYLMFPEDIKAELIGGVVYFGGPVNCAHGGLHELAVYWLGKYQLSTAGVSALAPVTVLLENDSEPQPDGCLRIIDGQTRENDDDFLEGAPELIVEIAYSSESYDLHVKRRDYERWAVQEYLVFVLREQRVVWLVRRGNRFVDLPPDDDGILRSTQFPGLWLDPQAFFREDDARVQNVLAAGLKSPEHAEFVERLASRGQ